MKKIRSFLQALAGLVVLAGLVLGLMAAFRALSGAGTMAEATNQLQESPLPGTPTLEAYPPPIPTHEPPTGYPPPDLTLPPEPTLSETEIAIDATFIAQATASAPAPIPTLGPLVGPQIIHDPLNHFNLQLFQGWYASTPSANAIAGVTSISNYDTYRIDDRPPGGMSIHISMGQLDAGQAFDQWLSNQRIIQTSPEYGAAGVTLTEPQPYTTGRYEGVTYTASNPPGEGSMVIYLLAGDSRIVGVDLRPIDAPALPEALLMLSTLEVLPALP
jgi:hypothetical protein